MNKKNSAIKPQKRSALSIFFLATAICWIILWLVYVLSGIPIVMLTKSVAYDPANMSEARSLLLSVCNLTHSALRWAFPFALPLVWQVVSMTSKTGSDAEYRQFAKLGLASILTAIALLLILAFSHGIIPIDELREGSGLKNNLLIRLHAVLTASPVGIAAVVYTLLARHCGKSLNAGSLHSFGKMAVVAASALLAVTLVAAFATVIKGTWMSIDWIVILPLAASVIYECSRASRVLTEVGE